MKNMMLGFQFGRMGKTMVKLKVFYMVRHVEFSIVIVMGISLYLIPGLKTVTRLWKAYRVLQVQYHNKSRNPFPSQNKMNSFHQTFQVPKMEVLKLIRLFWGQVFPCISLTYSLYR